MLASVPWPDNYHYFINPEALSFAGFAEGSTFSQDLEVEDHGLTVE